MGNPLELVLGKGIYPLSNCLKTNTFNDTFYRLAHLMQGSRPGSSNPAWL